MDYAYTFDTGLCCFNGTDFDTDLFIVTVYWVFPMFLSDVITSWVKRRVENCAICAYIDGFNKNEFK